MRGHSFHNGVKGSAYFPRFHHAYQYGWKYPGIFLQGFREGHSLLNIFPCIVYGFSQQIVFCLPLQYVQALYNADSCVEHGMELPAENRHILLSHLCKGDFHTASASRRLTHRYGHIAAALQHGYKLLLILGILQPFNYLAVFGHRPVFELHSSTPPEYDIYSLIMSGFILRVIKVSLLIRFLLYRFIIEESRVCIPYLPPV